MTVTVTDRCTGCGACLVTCPEGVLSPAALRPAVSATGCTDCLACVEVCPADAILPVTALLAAPARRRDGGTAVGVVGLSHVMSNPDLSIRHYVRRGKVRGPSAPPEGEPA